MCSSEEGCICRAVCVGVCLRVCPACVFFWSPLTVPPADTQGLSFSPVEMIWKVLQAACRLRLSSFILCFCVCGSVSTFVHVARTCAPHTYAPSIPHKLPHCDYRLLKLGQKTSMGKSKSSREETGKEGKRGEFASEPKCWETPGLGSGKYGGGINQNITIAASCLNF